MAAALTPIEQALETLLAAVAPPPGKERKSLLAALGAVLAEDVISTIEVPPCDNSAMDGYAVRCADLQPASNPQMTLPVSQRIAAGTAPHPLAEGTAARIFTGAPIPEGADAVVLQEDSELQGERVKFTELPGHRQHIRPAGQDIAAGHQVLAAGRRLRPQDIGVLASIGRVDVAVYRPLKVAVVSTGDELVEPGHPLPAGSIYNSNRYTLAALLTAMGFEVVDGGIIADDFDSTCEQLGQLAAIADAVVSSGGVSVGEEDHVKAAVNSLGSLALWKLNIKPGKPVAFGHIDRGADRVPFIGLPGNPSSVFVTFALIARPFLLRSQGQADWMPVEIRVAADFDWNRAGKRQEYLRARVETQAGGQRVRLYPNQSSGVLLSTSWANALVVMPPATTVRRGEPVRVLLLSELLQR